MRRYIPLLATFAVLIALFATAAGLYDNFFSGRVIGNLFGDKYAVIGIAAIGMTFVILSGGIDLSVGSVLAFTVTLVATLVVEHSWHPLAAIPLALLIGTTFGAGMGFLIQRYDLPPFLVTLAGMFFARGMAFAVNAKSITIKHELYTALEDVVLRMGKAKLGLEGMIFLAVLAIAIFVAHWTTFGRNIYALGGNESSARLMGLPVSRTKISVYALNGFCAALAGVVSTLYMPAGDPGTAVGLELDVIAAVVIGGTLLTGGVGYVAGTLGGVLIFGTIETALDFDGRLSSSWLRITISVLLLIFILLQRQLSRLRAGPNNS